MTHMTTSGYSPVPAEETVEIRAAAERIKACLQRTAEDNIENGNELLVVQERLPPFGNGYRRSFEFSDMTRKIYLRS